MNSQKINKLMNFVYPLISVLIMLAAWFILYSSAGSEYVFPSIIGVIKKIWSYFCSAEFYSALGGTLFRSVISFLISFALALAFGVLSQLFEPVKRVLKPVIAVLRAAPTIALMIILNLLLVKPTTAPVIVSLAVIFPMLYASVTAALGNVDTKLVEMADAYKVPLKTKIFSLYVPSVLPYILTESGSSLSFNVKLIVSAEIIAYTFKSLGGTLQAANVYADVAGVMAITIITILISVLLDLFVSVTVKLLFSRRYGK